MEELIDSNRALFKAGLKDYVNEDVIDGIMSMYDIIHKEYFEKVKDK